MRITSGNAVSQTVIASLVVLFKNGIQIAAVGIHRPVQDARQITKTPVGPDKTHCRPGDGTAEQRIDHAGQGNFKPFTQQIKAE